MSRFRALSVLAFAVAAATPAVASGPEMTPVTDQGDTLQCWAVTATARMDVDASERAGHGLKLSPRFTVYAKTRAEVIAYILAGDFKTYRGQLCEGCAFEKIYYEQGGVFADAVETVKLYGILPEVAYPGFPKKDEALFRDLNRLIGEYAHRASPPARQGVEERVTSVMNRHWGAPPARFEFGGATYDAKSFFDAYLPSWKSAQALELNYAPGSRERAGKLRVFNGATYRAFKTGNHDRLMTALEETLKAGIKPVIQYKVIDEEHTQRNGEIGFAVHGLEKPARIQWNDENILDHYVLAIGAEWDETGRLSRLLVKNTWDTSARAGFGFHWIEADYFSFFEAVEIDPGLEARFRREGLLP